MIESFKIKLLSNETVRMNRILQDRISKITRESINGGYTFNRFKLELLKEKKLEEIVIKEIYKLDVLSVDELERYF